MYPVNDHYERLRELCWVQCFTLKINLITILQEYSVNYMLRNGIEPHKLVLGLPMYGRTFKTQSPNSDKLGSTSLNAAFSGPYTREDGFMGFNEVFFVTKSINCSNVKVYSSLISPISSLSSSYFSWVLVPKNPHNFTMYQFF